MALHRLFAQPPRMDRTLILGFEGWIDAGVGAAQAVAAIKAGTSLELIGTFDGDALLDARARRPVLTLEDGVIQQLTWPTIEVHAGTDRQGRGLVLLTGPEPDLRWHEFIEDVLHLASDLSVTLTVGLGAFPAPVPHTRPVGLASTSTTRELADAIGFVPGTIEVPAGINAAIESAMGIEGRPATGLWARVPHYIANLPYPAASAALLDGLGRLTGITIDTAELTAASVVATARIDAAIAGSSEHLAMLRTLEQQWDAEHASGSTTEPLPSDLPTGDQLAAELERFLRGESS